MKKQIIVINKFVLCTKKLEIKFLCAFFSILIMLSEVSFAKIITVDDNGNADFTTIQAALNSAGNGDSIFVKPGVYKERIRVEKNITLFSENADSVIIMAEQNFAEQPTLTLFSDCTVKGFTFTSEGNLQCEGIYLTVYYKIKIIDNKMINLKNSIRILDAPVWGSRSFLSNCLHDTCYIEIYGNQITNNQVGIYLDGVLYLGDGGFDADVTYDAKENWWGTNDSTEIKKGIYDWNPRIVDFSNWLSNEIKDTVEEQDNGIHQNNIYNNSKWNIYVAQDQTEVKEYNTSCPDKIQLYQNYPNPFNPSTTIRFDLPISSHVTMKIFNFIGQEIATLVSSELSAGQYSVQWNADGLAGGVYFCKLQLGSLTETRKLVLLK